MVVVMATCSLPRASMDTAGGLVPVGQGGREVPCHPASHRTRPVRQVRAGRTWAHWVHCFTEEGLARVLQCVVPENPGG